ncbi:hypothetical protein BH10BAC5_BH10BAC5_25920 [soil metagenome]
MNFTIPRSVEILKRTPDTLISMLQSISPEWSSCNEGEGTWSVFDIVGHLIHGEKADWIPRTIMILSENPDKNFELFDRFAQFTDSKGKSLDELLYEFKMLREKNIELLLSMKISDNQLLEKGIHPAFGEVTLSQHLSAWVVHDLEHITQISRVMAKQYKSNVGPWVEYLKILK